MNVQTEPYQEPFSYLQWIVAARSAALNYNVSKSSRMMNVHNFISANAETFLPELPREEHLAFSREVKWNQMWAARDQREFHLVDTTTVTDESGMIEDIRSGNGSAIFCTFHVGSYRLINSMLYRLDIPYALVTDDEFIREQGESVREMAWDLQRDYLKVEPVALEILNAEDSTGALKALRKLRSNQSLLLYIDGNTGVGGHSADRSKYLQVDFLNQRIYARKGIAFLAYAAQVPIIPVMCIRTGWLDRELRFLPPIVPDRSIDREEFCLDATQKLFSILDDYVRRDPAQWEGWLYVQKFLNLDALMAEASGQETGPREFMPDLLYSFNTERFAILTFSEEEFLFDRRTFKLFPLPDTMKHVLEALMEPRKPLELEFEDFIVTEQAYRDLFNRDVIVPYESHATADGGA